MKKNIHRVTFKLSDTLYGVDVNSVQEITKSRKITKLPQSTSKIIGIINFREQVVPIIDLKYIMNADVSDIKDVNVKFIIIECEDHKCIGFIVDEISEVINLRDVEVSPSPESVSSGKDLYSDGIAQINEKLIVILNIQNIITSLRSYEIV